MVIVCNEQDEKLLTRAKFISFGSFCDTAVAADAPALSLNC